MAVEPFLGEIRLVSFGFQPRDWALCNGQIMSIAQNQALFALLGTMYGGNGQTTFALPDLRGRVPVHTSDVNLQGTRVGVEAHTLTAAELPTHTHALLASDGAATTGLPGGNLPAQGPSAIYGTTPTVALHASSLTNVGGGQPHSNLMPYLTLSYIISLVGIFPSQQQT